MSEWQPIETAPKDGTELQLYHKNIGQWIGSYRAGLLGEAGVGENYWRAKCCGRFATPTYWQHPPEPPK